MFKMSGIRKTLIYALVGVLLMGTGAAVVIIRHYGLIPRHHYETEPPAIPAFHRPAVLVLNKTNGFIHQD